MVNEAHSSISRGRTQSLISHHTNLQRGLGNLVRSVTGGSKRIYIRAVLVTSLSLSMMSHALAHDLQPGKGYSVTGKIIRVEIDYPDGTSKALIHIKDARSGRKYGLRFKNKIPANIRGGSTVTIAGAALSNETLQVENLQISQANLQEAVTGERSVAVVLVNFSDSANTCAPSTATSTYFGTDTSVNTLFRQSSYDQFGVGGAVFGPVTINYRTTDACNFADWGKAAATALSAQGVDVSAFNNVQYVLPSNVNCSWTGIAYVPGRESWVKVCHAGVAAHELGHNVGMRHASSGTISSVSSEYGDGSDFMGAAVQTQNNAPHKEFMGWLPTSQIISLTSAATVDIAPLEVHPAVAATGGLPQVLKIRKADTSEYYYLSYRRPIGFGSNMSTTYLDKLSVHRYNGYSRTVFLTALSDGMTFSDPTNNITVRLISHGADRASINVSLGQEVPCVRSAPALTLSPASQVAAPGASKTYTVSLKNNDNSACPASSFALSPSLPSELTGVIGASTMTLAAGASGTTDISVTLSSTASSGTYSFSLTAVDSNEATHIGSATGTLGTLAVDTTAPSPAPVLTARSPRKRRVVLSWTPSYDQESGIAGYTIVRYDGGTSTVVMTTTSLSYVTSEPSRRTLGYQVFAVDKAGNRVGSSVVTLTVR